LFAAQKTKLRQRVIEEAFIIHRGIVADDQRAEARACVSESGEQSVCDDLHLVCEDGGVAFLHVVSAAEEFEGGEAHVKSAEMFEALDRGLDFVSS
jgi:hypothetical protein